LQHEVLVYKKQKTSQRLLTTDWFY